MTKRQSTKATFFDLGVYGLLVKLVRSGWRNIDQVPSLHVFMDQVEGEVHKTQKRPRPISHHLDQTNLANKGLFYYIDLL